ncbi:MAG: Rne/Rng family ribonuclease [Thermoanaerobaculaceae bacterium]|jgi:ribonuclease E|nr:Rne/Rng family ribonuclease [Thermoanaerobaculaceae bacterium]
MTARMLINAQRPEELRVAIVVDDRLELFQTALAEADLHRGNIYRGVVVNLQSTLNAAFIDFGAEKHGFLAFHDIVPEAYHRKVAAGARPHRLDEVLERGKPILVQVTKDPGGQKGGALTTNISIAGRYLVFTPFDDMRGVSRKVEDEDTRRELKEQVAGLELPAGAGVIVRTNALGQTKTALSRDLTALVRTWKKVQAGMKEGKGSRLLYSDQDLVVQALRDFLDSNIAEVLVDDDQAFEKAEGYMKAFMPRSKTRLLRYTERMPLFARFDIEPQIESILQRTVALPGGGSIVIDSTEALTAIDVNSGRAKSSSQDEAIFQVNKEAAREVARQLRLRDIGGLVVVDFIDMRIGRHQREVEKTMREALKPDRARCSVGKISPNGLLEINRQRIKQSLGLRTRRTCPTCGGAGSIASAEAVGLGLLRHIEAEAAGGRLAGVRIELHPELADALQNGRRQELAALESEFDLKVEIIAAAGFHRSEQRVEWLHRERAPLHPVAAPEPVASAAEMALPEPPPAPSGRRRRRGRASEAPAEPVEATPVPAVEVQVEETAEQAAEPKRRRRRGGRRRKGRDAGGAPAPGEETAERAPATAETAAPREPAPSGGPEEAEAGGEARPRRRRRKRPAREREAGAGGGGGAAEAETAGQPPAESGEAGGEDGSQGAPGTAGGRSRRRRRHRRRAPGRGDEPSA